MAAGRQSGVPKKSSTSVTENAPARWQGLAAVADARTRALVLGSFPGVRSLQLQQYYAHPQNQFWRLLQALWPQHPQPAREDYAGRCEWLLARGLGLWDVYDSCEREGSLDSAIRAAQVNDFAGLRQRCPDLRLALHNGGGTGIGLHLCHHFCTQVLGGRLLVESCPGEGSRFSVRIPLRAP